MTPRGASDDGEAASHLPRPDMHIVLDREGRFLHDGRPIEHAGIVRAFRRWVVPAPDGGFELRASVSDSCPLLVEGPAVWVEDARTDGDRVSLGLWDGSREDLDPATLRVGPDGILACTVRGLPARFSRHAQIRLGELLEPTAEGELAIAIAGTRHPVPSE